MSEFVRISFPDLLKYQNISAERKNEDKKSVVIFNQREEEETTIYEYDIDCLKRKDRLGHSCLEHKKE
jgi:hypothetical protein